jgi:hypothetical protein
MTETNATQTKPPRKAVNILAMGASREDFIAGMMGENRPEIFRDAELWTINYMASVVHCDRLISIDPVHSWLDKPVVQEMCNRTLKAGVPVYTSEPHGDYPNQVMYPFHKVYDTLNSTYMNTTVAYALCLALVEGYNHIGLFGCDFTYPNYHAGEAGRACIEYWISWAAARGVTVGIASRSTLMDMNSTVQDYKIDEEGNRVPDGPPLQQPYGFFYDPMKLHGENTIMRPRDIIAKTRAWWNHYEKTASDKKDAPHEAGIVHLPRKFA